MDPNAVVEVFRRNITEHYFDTKGRVSRQEFWYFVLAAVVVGIGAAILDGIVGTTLLGTVVSLGLLLPSVGLGARRLQDIGRNGNLVWVWAVPYLIVLVIQLLSSLSGPYGALGFIYFFFTIGWMVSVIALGAAILLIYFWVQPGTEGANQYGPDPKGGAAPAAA